MIAGWRAAASSSARVSPGSSPARSEASRGAPCYAADAEPDPVPQVEASVGRSTQMLLAMAAMGGRGGHYGRRPASSYGSCAAGPICSPVSSRGGGGDDREPRAADDDASFVTPQMVSFFLFFAFLVSLSTVPDSSCSRRRWRHSSWFLI